MLPKFDFLLYYNVCCSSDEVSNLQPNTVFNIAHFKPFTKALSELFYDNYEYNNTKIVVWYC